MENEKQDKSLCSECIHKPVCIMTDMFQETYSIIDDVVDRHKTLMKREDRSFKLFCENFMD